MKNIEYVIKLQKLIKWELLLFLPYVFTGNIALESLDFGFQLASFIPAASGFFILTVSYVIFAEISFLITGYYS